MGDDESTEAALQSAFEERVLAWPDVTATVLFGFPAYRVQETVFAVLDTGAVVLTRLPAGGRERLADEYPVGPFEAYGQTIDSWVRVDATGVTLDSLLPFARESYERARSGTTPVPPPDDDE